MFAVGDVHGAAAEPRRALRIAAGQGDGAEAQTLFAVGPVDPELHLSALAAGGNVPEGLLHRGAIQGMNQFRGVLDRGDKRTAVDTIEPVLTFIPGAFAG